MSTVAKRYTPEDLLTMPDDGRVYELVDGELAEKAMSTESDLIGGNVFHQLKLHADRSNAGLAAPEMYYQCFPHDPDLVRRPDASFIRRERLVGIRPHGHCRIVPDLAVEVVSPNDLFEDVREKVKEYLAAGVRLVWVISPRTRTIEVYRIDGTVSDIDEKGELSGEDVLPDFRCHGAAIFALPFPTE